MITRDARRDGRAGRHSARSTWRARSRRPSVSRRINTSSCGGSSAPRSLLRNTDMPIVDVALSVGFSSQSHLSHWMIRQTGVSPAAYRRADP